MSTPLLIGCGLVMFCYGALMIHLSPYTKVKDPVTGITTYTEKATGRKFITLDKGYPTKINGFDEEIGGRMDK